MICEGYRCILIEYDARPYHVNLAILPPPDLTLLMKFPTLRILTHQESMRRKDRQDLVMRMRAENNRLNWGDVGEQGALLSKLGKPTCSCTEFNAIGCPVHDPDVAIALDSASKKGNKKRKASEATTTPSLDAPNTSTTDSAPVTPSASQAVKKHKKSPTPRETRHTQSKYAVQDQQEQLHYYMDLIQYMPSANQLRFIGLVEEIQVKDSNLVPAFTYIKK